MYTFSKIHTVLVLRPYIDEHNSTVSKQTARLCNNRVESRVYAESDSLNVMRIVL